MLWGNCSFIQLCQLGWEQFMGWTLWTCCVHWQCGMTISFVYYIMPSSMVQASRDRFALFLTWNKYVLWAIPKKNICIMNTQNWRIFEFGDVFLFFISLLEISLIHIKWFFWGNKLGIIILWSLSFTIYWL